MPEDDPRARLKRLQELGDQLAHAKKAATEATASIEKSQRTTERLAHDVGRLKKDIKGRKPGKKR